jgi:threonine dehydratase
VQTDGLVQSVNAVQVRPYDERAVVAGTRVLLGELARQAPSPTSSSPGSP